MFLVLLSGRLWVGYMVILHTYHMWPAHSPIKPYFGRLLFSPTAARRVCFARAFGSTPCSYRITHRRRGLPTVPGPRVRRHHSGPGGKIRFTHEEPADRGFRVILARLAGRTRSVKGGTWTVVTTLLSSLLPWAVHISGLVRVTPYLPPYHGLGHAARCCTGTCLCSSGRASYVQ